MTTILVGTDSSAAADLAVDHAARLARDRESDLVVRLVPAGGFGMLGLAQERWHGHRAAVYVGLLREAELMEHRVDVLLDRSFGQEELLRDRRVVLALGHVRQDLALALGELTERRMGHPV